MDFYAHTDGSDDKNKWEKVSDHLIRVRQCSGDFADRFGSKEWGKLLGLEHDIGKYHPDFQKKLRGESIECHHSPAGAYLVYLRLEEKSKVLACAMAQIIGGHHSGLHNRQDLFKIINRGKQETWDEVEKYAPDKLINPPIPEIPGWLDLTDHISVDLWIRFLFSCLIDADRLMTEAYLDPKGSQHREWAKNDHASLKDLKQKFEEEMIHFGQGIIDAGAAGKPINFIRQHISNQCVLASYGEQGVYACTVPTGGGKTLSLMRFALHHAVQHGLERIIVVIPYTSIIDQNAEVYTRIFGTDNVLEHHSNIDLEKKEAMARGSGTRLSYFAQENWDVPIVVTTNVQFFESLFSNDTGRCRKVHNIAKSVIIFDEVQLFPVKYVEPIVVVINRLVKEYGCTAVLSTATQPSFDQRFIWKDYIEPKEIISSPKGLSDRLRRVKIHWPKNDLGTSWDVLSKRILRVGRESLSIVNLKQDAVDLAQQLKSMRPNEPVFHLSTRMCPVHRREKIKTIKKILLENKKLSPREKLICRVVSTQLIEAGVDIDFPHVFRAMAGFDSIGQAAGRCNREDDFLLGHLHIFNPLTEPPEGILRSGLAVARRLLKQEKRKVDPLDPVWQSRYFEELYMEKCLDDEGIGKKKAKGDFKDIAEKFKIIDDATFTVLVPWDKKAERLLREILHTERLEKRHLRAMQPYTVSIYKKEVDALMALGVLEQVVIDDELKAIWYVRDMSAYDDDFGLIV